MTNKSPDAFRTISEVADWLGVPTHVLRFWESRFSQVKPVKRAGGRRYYRPADMELLGGIRTLLHEDGMTIRGVQKMLRESGLKHVAAMSPGLDSMEMADAKPSNVIELETASEAKTENAPEPESLTNAEPSSDTPETTIEDAELVEPAQSVDMNAETPFVPDNITDPESEQGEAAQATQTPETPEGPQILDISHIPADPIDDEADVPAAQAELLQMLRSERKSIQSPSENNDELGAIVLRLTLLKNQMEQGKKQA